MRQIVLAGAARKLPPYLRLATPSALPVLAVHSCHLPRDHTAAAVINMRVTGAAAVLT